jgi:uncharacterized protein involved in exopolysaccharide biosynthesis
MNTTTVSSSETLDAEELARQPSEPLLTTVLAIARRWRTIVVPTIIGAAIAVLVTVFSAKQYLSTTSFFTISKSSSLPSNISSLAGSFGLSGMQPDAEGPQFFADMLRTTELLSPLVHENLPAEEQAAGGKTLLDLYGGSSDSPAVREERAIEKLTGKVIGGAVNAKTGVVTLDVTTKWPRVSQWLATRLVARLNEFNLGRRRLQAGEERQFAEGLLRLREDSLRIAENAEADFVQRNRDYRNSPSLTLDAERLQREVGYQLSLRTTVAGMYEESRVREVRDTPAIVVIDSPHLPARPVSRHVGTYAVIGAIFGALAGILAILFWRTADIQRRLGDPEAAAFFNWVARLKGRPR